MGKFQFMEAELERLQEANVYRTVKVFQSPQSRRVLLDGKAYLMLSSNSYLDLCNDPSVKQFVKQVAEQYGTGTGGARLTTGTSELTARLEQQIAKFKGTESAMVFNFLQFATRVGPFSAML